MLRINALQFIISFCLLLFVLVGFSLPIQAEDTPTPSPSISPTPASNDAEKLGDLQKQISDLSSKVVNLQAQEKSLSSQISVMDSQIKLTQYRIEATKKELEEVIADIGVANEKIGNLEKSLNSITKVLVGRIVATYQIGSIQPVQVLLASSDVTDFVQRANYLRLVQAHDKKLMYNTQQAKNDYQSQKSIFEAKKQKVESLKLQLEEYTKQLDLQKNTKQRLLAETQGSEANYQRLLTQARAQLAGFSRFTASQGGASLLTGQTVCDDWGCYYNQRDSQWGGSALNNSQYTLASDGCLVTSMAMVYTHYGHRSVTPATINSNPSNFASYEPAWLNKTIIADGTTASRISASIDDELSAGRPVIVGISYDGGPYPDHFLVLISGSGGNYQMNDPYTPNGHNISFSSKYSVGSIREIERVSM